MQFPFVVPLGLVVVLQHDNKQHLCQSYSKLNKFNILMLPLKKIWRLIFSIPVTLVLVLVVMCLL